MKPNNSIFLFRNSSANGPTTVAEIRTVPDLGAPHRGASNRPETCRRDPAAAIGDQPDTRGAGPDGGGVRRRRALVAPRRGAGLRTGQVISVAGDLLQREQTAELALLEGARDAQSSGFERCQDADAHHRTVPIRPQVTNVEESRHADD